MKARVDQKEASVKRTVPWWVGWAGLGIGVVTLGQGVPVLAIVAYYLGRNHPGEECKPDPRSWLKAIGYVLGFWVPLYGWYTCVRLPTKAYEEGMATGLAKKMPWAHRAMIFILGSAFVVTLLVANIILTLIGE